MLNRLVSNQTMEIFTVRRQRLKLIIDDDFGGNQAAFSRATKIKSPQINRWLSTTAADKRNITEQSARMIEAKAGKPARWLDEPEAITRHSAAELPAPPYIGIKIPQKSRREKDLEEINALAMSTDATGLGMLLEAARRIAEERPASKTASSSQ
jgi:hypothetical protein